MTGYSNAEAIKDHVTMRDVCDRYGIEVRRGDKILCPFHGDHNPSMLIYPGRRGYHCFSCGRTGDVIDFVKNYFGLSYIDALAKLNDDFALGLNVKGSYSPTTIDPAVSARLTNRKRMEQRVKALDTAYSEATGNWVKLYRQINDLKMGAILCESEDEAMDIADKICDAQKRLSELEYTLNCTEADLYRVRQKLKEI